MLDTLAARACPEGGWGYAPGQGPQLEPTCLSLLALHSARERHAGAVEAGRAFLDSCRHPDGLYRLGRGRPEAVWPTAMVLFVQATLGYPEEQINQTAAALLGLKGRDVSRD